MAYRGGMATTQVDSSQRWKLGWTTLDQEYIEELELKVEGTVPEAVAGTLLRMGPAKHEFFGRRNQYWFEGNGMIHAFRFDGGRVWYRNRYINTAKLREERESGAAGRTRIATIRRELRRLAQPVLMFNPGNTKPVVHAGKLLAMSEQGHPHEVNLSTLDTVGLDDLGVIPRRETYTAHPKVDVDTGELWNVGLKFPGPEALVKGATVQARVYRRDTQGKTQVVATHPLPTPTFAHDIGLSRTKLAIVAPPLYAPRIPWRMVTGLDDFIGGLVWDTQLGTKILVIDRVSGDARTYETGPFVLHHTVNAFDDGDDLILDLCPYPDPTVTKGMFMGPIAGVMPTPDKLNQSWPERLTLRADGTVERRKLGDVPLDFPTIAPQSWLREHRWIYGVTGYLGAPVAVDSETGRVIRFPLEPNAYAGEPIAVPKPGGTSETDVWLLCLVLGEYDVSEVRVFDGADLGGPPVARIILPHAIPFDYHGTWLPEGAATSLP